MAAGVGSRGRGRRAAMVAAAVSSGWYRQGSIRLQGIDRTWTLHRPATAPTPCPGLLALHGGFAQGLSMARLGHLDALAERHGFIAVYPDGVARSWNDGRGNTPAAHRGIDDVGFIATLLGELAADHGADPARIHAVGISNGAMLAYRLACELSERVASIVPVAGCLPARLAATFDPTRVVPVLAICGTEDRLVPYGGGRVKGRGGGGEILGAEASVAMFARRAGCNPEPTVDRLPPNGDDGTAVDRLVWSGHPDGARFELWRVVGGGHTWPGGPQYLPVRWVGKASGQFDAGEVAWSFCRAQTVA